MGVKVAAATTAAAATVPRPPPPLFPQTLAFAVSSPSQKRRSFVAGEKFLLRTRSCEHSTRRRRFLRRSCSATASSSFSGDDEIQKKIQEFAMDFQLLHDDVSKNMFLENQSPFAAVEPPEWAEIIPASIERKANSVDLPLSLRIIKRKKQWQKGLNEAGESAYCSVKKAFSNMVLIIRELNSYTLQMREVLSYAELQGILMRVEKEMHASFVWLFQQVFSHTPTLMVYVMILLANYSVHSVAGSAAMAAAQPPVATVEVASVAEDHDFLDSSAIKSFSVSSIGDRESATVGGNGGGGKVRPVANGTDGGDGGFDRELSQEHHRTIVPDGVSSVGNSVFEREDESRLWSLILDQALAMQPVNEVVLDSETTSMFVSPVHAEIEADDDYDDYFRTEMMYQRALEQEPDNSLLLANYAQFLHLVAQDYDRAEEYFKRAVRMEPRDAEALNKYATFLWQVRKDIWGAEQTYQDAVAAAEPDNNSFYAASYAHFLWNTGGEDTCFPLDNNNGADTGDAV